MFLGFEQVVSLEMLDYDLLLPVSTYNSYKALYSSNKHYSSIASYNNQHGSYVLFKLATHRLAELAN